MNAQIYSSNQYHVAKDKVKTKSEKKFNIWIKIPFVINSKKAKGSSVYSLQNNYGTDTFLNCIWADS